MSTEYLMKHCLINMKRVEHLVQENLKKKLKSIGFA